jgi:3-oxoacyl-[acyl-carrier-protein] synthase II
MQRRVVITGLGVVTPLGIGVQSFWQGLVEGRSGVDRISLFDPKDLGVQIAAEVRDFDPANFVSPREARHMDRFAQFAVAASLIAVKDARLEIGPSNRDRCGVLIGTGIGGINTLTEQHKVLLERGPQRVSPYFVPMMIGDMASGQVSILLGARGPNSCVTTACATGTNAIGDAFRIISRGEADVMVAGGTEAAIHPLAMAGFDSAKALSRRNDEPQRASRPFDAKRDGFVMGEGAGTVILESLDYAEARGADAKVEIVGYGMTGDAYHVTLNAPNGEGAARAMAAAIADAAMAPEEIEYVNAHGTSTPPNDVAETQAIKSVFGEHARKLAISSNKSMIGHLLGAAGAVELIATALTLRHGIIPPTVNYEFPDPECDLDYVPNSARRRRVKTAISNSFGFGGHNAALVVRELV